MLTSRRTKNFGNRNAFSAHVMLVAVYQVQFDGLFYGELSTPLHLEETLIFATCMINACREGNPLFGLFTVVTRVIQTI